MQKGRSWGVPYTHIRIHDFYIFIYNNYHIYIYYEYMYIYIHAHICTLLLHVRPTTGADHGKSAR
jgi:hypothetical protein